jgi:hypothetical protein
VGWLVFLTMIEGLALVEEVGVSFGPFEVVTKATRYERNSAHGTLGANAGAECGAAQGPGMAGAGALAPGWPAAPGLSAS